MDSIDFNHMFNPIFINMLQNVFGFNWFEVFFGVKQCGVDIVWAGWDVYLLFKNLPWSKCIWPDRSKIWMFEWLSLHVGFNKTAVVFFIGALCLTLAWLTPLTQRQRISSLLYSKLVREVELFSGCAKRSWVADWRLTQLESFGR